MERENKFAGSFDRRAGPTGNKRCDVCGKWLVSGSPCRCPRPQDEAISDVARQWQGWGTALKPAWEPLVVARKPLSEKTVAANVLEHGTGALNIDGCRVEGEMDGTWGTSNKTINLDRKFNSSPKMQEYRTSPHQLGRWPANLVHDGSDEVLAAFPDAPGQQRAVDGSFAPKHGTAVYGDYGPRSEHHPRKDSGSAARFFYCAKASKAERGGSDHPTIKPVALMRWLVRLVTPPGGVVLDPFSGSGTTGMAAAAEGFRAVLIERDKNYFADIRRRIGHISGADSPLFQAREVNG